MSEDITRPNRPTMTDQLKEGDEAGAKLALNLFRQAFTELRAYQVLKVSEQMQTTQEANEKIHAFNHLEHALIQENGSTVCPHCGESCPSIFTAYVEDADEIHCVWCIQAEEDKEASE